MAKGYWINVFRKINDPKKVDAYRALAGPVMQASGGKFLVRGGQFEQLEGSWQPTRLVLLEFPSMEQAKRWYDSEEYREPKALRLKASKANLIMVEGA